MAKGPELLLKPTHGLIEERRGFLRESAPLPAQLRAQPAKRASSARKLLPVPTNGVHKSKQPLLRRTQAVPLRPGCAKLLQAPLHHGFGEFFLGFEVVVDVAYRHASRLGDVRQTRLSETASIRQLRRSLNQPRSFVRLCRSHILRLGGVSYLTNSDHKPDAPCCQPTRHAPSTANANVRRHSLQCSLLTRVKRLQVSHDCFGIGACHVKLRHRG